MSDQKYWDFVVMWLNCIATEEPFSKTHPVHFGTGGGGGGGLNSFEWL